MVSTEVLPQFNTSTEALSLAKFGFNPQERISSSDNFRRQLETYALHVIEDRPVSNAYSYFVDRGEVFIDRDKKTKLDVDPEERGGLASYGTAKAITAALSNPGKLVYFYSPPGPVTFEKGTKYDGIRPYSDGQLYLLNGKDIGQVNAIAVSVSREKETDTLSAFMGRDNLAGGFDDESEKIKHHLTNPVSVYEDADDLLTRLDEIAIDDDFTVYRNVHNEEFRLSDIIAELKRGFMMDIKPKIEINYDYLYDLAMEKGAHFAYLGQLQNYFPIYSQNGKMVLGGSCGGDGITKGELSSQVELVQFNPLSTNFRLSTQSAKEILNKKEDRYDSYECPNCGVEHKGEVKGSDPKTWLTKCGCGFEFRCAV